MVSAPQILQRRGWGHELLEVGALDLMINSVRLRVPRKRKGSGATPATHLMGMGESYQHPACPPSPRPGSAPIRMYAEKTSLFSWVYIGLV